MLSVRPKIIPFSILHLIIVEDLEIDRKQLAELIQQDCARTGLPVDLSFYESGEAFLEQCHPVSCDGIFLDILMKMLSGVDVARKVREAEPRLPIIFTTTEPDYALDSFSVHAMNFWVKPLSAEKVSWCLKELTDYLETPARLSLTEISGRGHSKPLDIPLDSILFLKGGNKLPFSHRRNKEVQKAFLDWTFAHLRKGGWR